MGRVKDLVYHRMLLPAVERSPDRVANIDGPVTTTFEEHVSRTSRLAGGLRERLGLSPTDRFAVMALNSHQYLELYHAAFLGAGVINPLNLRLAPMELEFILQDSQTTVCFVDKTFAPLIDQVRANTSLRTVVLVGDGGDDVPHDVTYDEVLASGRDEVPAEPDEDGIAVLMYTGGTTGLPKGVVIDHRAAMLTYYKILTRWPFDEDNVYLHQTPMFHAASFGGILSIPSNGATTTYVPAFEPGAVLDVTERHQVTATVMVPTMVQMVLDHPAFAPERFASMRVLTYGASPMPATVLQRLLELFPDLGIYQGYGMTENCGVLTCLTADDHRRGGDILGSVGRPVPGTVVSIQDTEGRILPPGEVGEVCARGGNYLREYWNRPEETVAAFAGGWYHTGDAGRFDGEGYLYLVDRVKDMIVTGGENVYSSEVESALGSHPAVAQVAVIGIPSEQWGEAVHAIVVPRPGTTVDDEELRAWARERIAGYKVPKTIELRAEPLPLSGAMKVLKRELRAPYWEGKDRLVQ